MTGMQDDHAAKRVLPGNDGQLFAVKRSLQIHCCRGKQRKCPLERWNAWKVTDMSLSARLACRPLFHPLAMREPLVVHLGKNTKVVLDFENDGPQTSSCVFVW
jgi:hypothetical protein